MLLETYKERIKEFAIYPEVGTSSKGELMYLALGLSGEAGEIAEKVKKYYRDATWDDEAVIKEIGDVFWYLCQFCNAIDLDPSLALYKNIQKLKSRKERGVISGSGDDR